MLKATLPLTLALAAASALAGPARVEKKETKEKSVYDSIWDSLTLYKNKDGLFLNEFRIVGRAHFDEYYTDSNLGWDQDWAVRRLRLGVKAPF